MEPKKQFPPIPSFPFDSGSKSIFKLLANMVALWQNKVKLWENARFVFIEVPLNPGETNKLLPAGMFLSRSHSATFFIADYTKTAFTVPYKECALLVHVRTPFGAGVHCPWMIVDDDTALIYGRELLGYPKKMGELNFTEEGRTISAGLTRRGVKLISVKAEKKFEEIPPRPMMGLKTFNIGGMGQFTSLNPIWMFKPGETIHEAYAAEAELTIADSPYDPIKKLIADYKNPLPARIGIIDIMKLRYMIPVGLTGVRVYANTFENRFR